MPTNANAYNSRVTDESLEKRFRDTFRSQGGAELVDDLYAQGVIVPVVDFTAAATGQQLAQNLQTAWDSSTGSAQVNNQTTNLITNAGFWQVDVSASFDPSGSSIGNLGRIEIFDGSTANAVWGIGKFVRTDNTDFGTTTDDKFVVFLRSGDTLRCISTSTVCTIEVWYRQIATISGDLVNPSGFTSS